MAMSLLVSLLLALTVPSALANCPTPLPLPSSQSKDWFAGRYFFFSADEPIATTLRKNTRFVRHVDATITVLENVERVIVQEQRRRLSAPDSDLALRKPRICNLEDSAWGSSAVDQMFLRGYPRTLTTSCITDYEFPDRADEARLREGVQDIASIVHSSAPEIAEFARTNFSEPSGIYNWPYSTKTEDCYVNVLGAFRTGARWYLNIGITNWNQQNHVGEFSRQYINENIGRGCRAGPMTLLVRPKGNKTHTQRSGTTMIISHRGEAGAAVFKGIPLKENLAVIRALNEAQRYSQQVSDALSPSSIAILVLPLALNMIPIALLADVSTTATLIYAMLSDVLTVFPLGIKGVELISIGSDVYYGSVLRMSSDSSGSMSEMAAAEAYVAQCFSKKNVLPTGIVFLTGSIVFMILGLLAEIVAKRYAIRHRRRLYGRISLSSSRSSSSAAEQSRSRSNSFPMNEVRGAEHFGMELDSYESAYNDDHRL